jgi:long-chain fatty acid transport protein
MFGMGARSPGLAGTGVADAEGYDATYANPAGLVGPTRRRLTLGYVHAGYRIDLDGLHRPIDTTDGLVLGADLPIPFGGVLRDRVALGLGFYFPFGVVNRARAPFPDEPRLALLDSRTQVVSVLVAGGFHVHDRVDVGVGVLALAALVGRINIAYLGGRITTVAEEQLTTSLSPIVGIRVRARRGLRLGAVFRGESKSTYDIDQQHARRAAAADAADAAHRRAGAIRSDAGGDRSFVVAAALAHRRRRRHLEALERLRAADGERDPRRSAATGARLR